MRLTLLSAIAVSALLAGQPAARAQDFNQQATPAEQDDATNWTAAEGARRAYDRAPGEFERAPGRDR
jgi:hypothetical protein